MSRILHLIRSEIDVFHPRLWLARIMVAFLPIHSGNHLRALALRLAGFDIGPRVVFFGMPRIVGSKNLYQNLKIGQGSWFNIDCYMDLGDKITIGEQAGFGHEVMLLTTTHELGGPERRVGPPKTAPVHIGSGVWLGARCTILPGVTVHNGAVVGAGSIVTRDVPANTIVAGVPAQVIRRLDENDENHRSNNGHGGDVGLRDKEIFAAKGSSQQDEYQGDQSLVRIRHN